MTRVRIRIRSTLLAAAAAAAAAATVPVPAAVAATPAAEALEEIVVTARKREERLQDVPISVAAVSGTFLAENAIGRLDTLTAELPNVHVGESGVLDNVFIRGIGSGTNQGFEQSVGTFQDGLYYGRSRNSRAPFLDVERVEVLKGPQSILFGKNTIAGAINIASAVPTERFEGYATGTYGFERGDRSVTGVLSGPVADGLRLRGAVRASDGDGWVENVALGRDEPETQERALRLTAIWDVADATTLTLRGEATSFDTVGRQVEVSRCSAQLRTILATRDPREDCTFDARKTSAGTGPFGREDSESDTRTVGATLEHDFGGAVLTSVTGYVAYDYRDLSQPTSTSLPVLLLDVREDFEQWSQELRLASPAGGTFDWVGGLYWQKADLDARFDTNVNPAGAGFPFPSGNRANDFVQEASTYAAFAQGTWAFASAWSATAGLRWTHEEKDVDKRQVIALPFERVPTTNPGVLGFFRQALGSTPHALADSRSESNISPSVQVQWRPADGVMTYASFARGFKGGGFDALLPNGDPRFFEFKPEKATAWELGAKTEFGGSARLNVAVFRNEFDDLQVSTFDGALSFVVGNAAKAVAQGLELDAQWAPGGGWRLGVAAAYLDSTYDSFRNASCWFGQTAAQGCVGGVQDLSGAQTQFAPKWSGTARVSWERPLGAMTLRLATDVNATTRFYIPSDNDPNTTQGGYAKLNARAALAGADDRWEVAVIGRNLTDRLTTSWSNDVPLFNGSYFRFVDRPREVSLQGTLRF